MSSRILIFATLGHGSNDEDRVRHLVRDLGQGVEVFPFDSRRKRSMFWRLLQTIQRTRPEVVVMEGTGLPGGAALIIARLMFGQRYVVSSGDAVGPWVGSRVWALGPVFGLYERVLCRFAAGFIGWTPYLAGRALTFGTPRVMTAPGWAPFTRTQDEREADRRTTRERLGIPQNNLVVGIAGNMTWTRRYGYCYGAELVEAARLVSRPDVTFLIVGDGTGRPRLEARAEGLPHGRVVFTGRVPQADLPPLYAAMDVGSLPQSVDRVGSFRYTTKLSEYLAFRLPVVTGQIPLAYDLDDGWLWRLPGSSPWDQRYVAAMAELIERISLEQLRAKRDAVPVVPAAFDPDRQARRVAAFIRELTSEHAVPVLASSSSPVADEIPDQ